MGRRPVIDAHVDMSRLLACGQAIVDRENATFSFGLDPVQICRVARKFLRLSDGMQYLFVV